MTSSVEDFDKKLNCVCSRWAADDGADHSAHSNIAKLKTIDAGDCYGLVPLSTILPVYHIVISSYIVHPF